MFLSASYLKGLGYSGSINDMNAKFIKTALSVTSGSVNELADKYFKSLGGTGSLSDSRGKEKKASPIKFKV